MPTYEYECQKCEKHFEVQETIGAHAEHHQHRCPTCGSPQVRQVIASVHVQTSRKS